MLRTARGNWGVDNVLAAIVVIFLSLLTVSPSSAATARVGHSRRRSAAPKAPGPAVNPVTFGVFNSDHEILTRPQNEQRTLERQRTLEKQTADFNAAIQGQMAQLSSRVENSERETQQMLEGNRERIVSTQRLLKVIIALLVLFCGGLLFLARRLPGLSDRSSARLQDNASAWKRDVMEPKLQDDDGIVSWRKGEQLWRKSEALKS